MLVAIALAGLGPCPPMHAEQTNAEDKASITDEALVALRENNLLHALVGATGDAGGKRPTNAAAVTTLDLSATAVTDVGLKELAPLKNLTRLYLDKTKLNGAGLKYLASFPNLTIVYLRETHVTDASIKELQKALPLCTIEQMPKKE
jgi:hypothetical protein